MKSNRSETITENIFRDFYGSKIFIEKSAIPASYGFISKQKTSQRGYPDFLLDTNNYVIVVEAKSDNINQANKDVKFYINNNNITKHIIGIAIAGQSKEALKVSYYLKRNNSNRIEKFNFCDCLKSLEDLNLEFFKKLYGDDITDNDLTKLLQSLNKFFNDYNIRYTDRSLFFSAILIALKDNNFRNIYQSIQAEKSSNAYGVSLECARLNTLILESVESQLYEKVNSHSKQYAWLSRFGFIKNIDIPIDDYKYNIKRIEDNIYALIEKKEKQDLLGKAYKIFLSRAGAAENKNIILTPDHIKSLMVRLARITRNSVVLDTCTGSGGFLMESMERMIEEANGDNEIIERIISKQLIGIEIDPVLFSLACSNMFLHGDGRTNLIFGNSLINKQSAAGKDLFDYITSLSPSHVIINPPYENRNPIKFTKQALEFLKENGKLIVIMPSVTLMNNIDNGVLRNILNNAKLDFVINLPKTIFKEQKRDVYPSIFGFTKTPHKKYDEVIFCNLYEDCLVSIQHKGRQDKNNLWYDSDNKTNLEQRIFEVISNRQCTDIVVNGKIVGHSYTKKIIHGDTIQLFFGINEDALYLPKFGELFNCSERGTLQSEKNDSDGEYDFITAAEIWKKHSTYDHEQEAIIYAVDSEGSLGRATYVNGKFIASNLCLILTEMNHAEYPIDLEFYSYYLMKIRAKIVEDLGYGVSKRTISVENLKNYRIEYFPLERQIQLKAKIKNNLERIKRKQDELNSLKLSVYDDIVS